MIISTRWLPVLFLFGLALLGSALHSSMEASLGSWSNVLPTLYILPVVVAAMKLGWKAALGVAIAAGGAHSVVSAIGEQDPWMRPLAETILFASVGITAARLNRHHGRLTSTQAPVPKPRGDEGLVNAFQGTSTARTSRALRDITTGLVRRFRTPVSSIEGAVWLLQDARIPEEKREEFLNIIRKETHRLDRALSDLLEFTQPRRPILSSVDLAALLDRVIQSAGPKEHCPFLLFRKEVPPDLPPLRCDPDLIAKMLHNIAINAIQATPNGGQIWLSARVEAGNVVISIKDPGRGIAPGTADRVFDAFFTTRENALGLGLTVARQIAAAHGGTITVNNMVGKGTSVTISLPMTPSQNDEHGPHSRS